jgi:hypothetical protein
MTQFVVTATAIPTAYNRPKSFVVEADSPTDAMSIVQDRLLDLGSVPNYVYEAKPYTPPPKGRIVEAR